MIEVYFIPHHHSKHQGAKQKSNICMDYTGPSPSISSEEPQTDIDPGLTRSCPGVCRDGPSYLPTRLAQK